MAEDKIQEAELEPGVIAHIQLDVSWWVVGVEVDGVFPIPDFRDTTMTPFATREEALAAARAWADEYRTLDE